MKESVEIYISHEGTVKTVLPDMDHFIGDRVSPVMKDILIEMYSQNTIDVIKKQYELAIAAEAEGLAIDGFVDDEGFDAIKVALVHGTKLQVGGILPPERPLN